jgi:hypothetical protein
MILLAVTRLKATAVLAALPVEDYSATRTSRPERVDAASGERSVSRRLAVNCRTVARYELWTIVRILHLIFLRRTINLNVVQVLFLRDLCVENYRLARTRSPCA